MAHRSEITKRAGSRVRFFGDTVAELKKVVWLSRREAVYLTGLVLMAAIAIGLFLGAFDYGFAELINKLFLGG